MRVKRVFWLLTCMAVVLGMMLPAAVFAAGSGAGKTDKHKKENKVIRVGWYESAFHHTDEFGRRSGYGYEYQMRVAIYAGWTYEYVDGSWPELFEKLQKGEIDLLSDVSYTEERAKTVLYSSEAMGSEGYHVFITPDNTDIRPDDFSTLNGKKIAVNKGSIQEELFRDWAKEHGVHPVIVETLDKTPEILEKLRAGEYDALVTLDTYGNTADIVPVCKVGFAESYFGINKKRPDIKKDIDVAMSRLIEDNRDFNQQLTERFNKASAVNSFLTLDEKEWIQDHGMIRIGYRDDFLPFCDRDEKTGELRGALLDYINFAKTCEKNAILSFDTEAYGSTEEALMALKNGEIDCVFPLGISAYDAEKYNVIVTDPLVSTEMYVAVRNSDHQGLSSDREMTVAVIKGHPSYESFIMDYFPKWKMVFSDDIQAAFQAVASGEADCGLVNNYRISRINEQLVKNKLTALATGEALAIGFGVSSDNDCLYSILNKINRLIPDTMLNASLTNYGFRDEKVSTAEFIRENLATLIAIIAIIMIVILLLVIRNISMKQKMNEGRKIISEAEKDPLTGLYSWNFFIVYAGKLSREHPDDHMDAVVMNIDRFHSVNAMYGREFGDRVLKVLAEEIKSFLAETTGIASRYEADRFDIYCAHRTDWQEQLRRFQDKLDKSFHHESIRLRMGVKPWQEGVEPVQQFDQARTACNMVRSDVISRILIYDTVMGAKEERDQMIMNDLSRAIENRELQVYYQPKYDIRSDEPVLSSAEALIRWNHPQLGFICPDDFIPLFESNGQISDLDNYVWAEAARQVAEWRDRLGVIVPVSVNLSRVDIFDQNLPDTFDGLLEKYGLGSSDILLEVTESAYTDNAEKLMQVIEGLRAKGYKIEMDDFGSGYSSLNMLSTMPVDVLKMDIEFIRNIEYSEKDRHLVELILDIARNLQVPVVAEGVENENQLKILKDAGCSVVQGYYFARPLPPEDFEMRIIKK